MGEQKLNEFEPVSYDAWLELAARDLQGAPFEKKLVKRIAGVDVRPLYTRQDARDDAGGLPGFAPHTRGSAPLGVLAPSGMLAPSGIDPRLAGHAEVPAGREPRPAHDAGPNAGSAPPGWDVRFELGHGDPHTGAQAISDNLQGGASSLFVVLDRAARAASDEHGLEGVAVADLNELDTLLAPVPLASVPISFDAGASALAVSAGLVALAKRRGVDPAALSGSFGLDPLGTLARCGSLPGSLEDALESAADAGCWASRNAPRVRAVTVDSSPFHEAGADAASELALALAAGIEYLRALTRAGLGAAEAGRQISFRFSVGRDLFMEVAKLRAARRTWARVLEAAGASPDARAMVLHAQSSRRTKTQRDPWVNLLRGTAESFAAAIAGADAITTASYDAALGEPSAFGQRIARNTQHILRYEANLGRVVDPAGGSWYVESITEALAECAWQRMQQLERAGGLGHALLQGSVQQDLKAVLDAERKAVETRKLAITGVNEFPHLREEPLARPAHGAARSGAGGAPVAAGAEPSDAPRASSDGGPGTRFASALDFVERGVDFAALRGALCAGTPARCPALSRERLAQPFEVLRDRAERALAQSGARPSVFLANLGPISEHKARASYAQNCFEAGGLAALSNDGFDTPEAAAKAFAESGAPLAALCASDASYAELAEPTARALKAQGARAIILAGNPGGAEATYRAAGITDFIYVGSNAVETLRSLLERAGVA